MGNHLFACLGVFMSKPAAPLQPDSVKFGKHKHGDSFISFTVSELHFAMAVAESFTAQTVRLATLHRFAHYVLFKV